MPQEPLSIEDLARQDGKRVLRLKGPLVISNLFDFQSRVRSSTSQALILDLTDVPYVDSAAIGALVGAHISHQKGGRALMLVGVCERVHHALQITNVESLFVFYPSIDAADHGHV
ncbi:MAG TPA: STAS domain-containing protein [Terriglobales bacterium]